MAGRLSQLLLLGCLSPVAVAAASATRAMPVVETPQLGGESRSLAAKSTMANGDTRQFIAQMPDDPYLTQQWNLQSQQEVAGASGLLATHTAPGSAPLVVAIVDSGVLFSHPDIAMLPGYDFIDNPLVSGDGDGRDADPTDPGDWVDAGNRANFSHCRERVSSWHGTRMAGIVGATTGNGIGIAAAAGNVQLLPVRVTGTCGGYVDDLVDGLRWAAGLAVPGVPENPFPAAVINLSLGFAGHCPTHLQAAINEATAGGAIIVTAATNSAVDLDRQPYSPATCHSVLTAGAATRAGQLADYSAYGSAVDVLAPGGSADAGILTTDNPGRTVALPVNDYAERYGTSIAGAHLAGAVATLKQLSPALGLQQVSSIIRSTATPVAGDAGCRALACGGGLLNAQAAVQAMATPGDDAELPPQSLVTAAAAAGEPTGVDGLAAQPLGGGAGSWNLAVLIGLLALRCSWRRAARISHQ